METYYSPESFANYSADGIGRFNPELWEKYMDYFGSVYQDAALTSREKSLIALGVAAALQCPYCIDAYTNSLISKGVSSEQIMEVFHVATSIRAGATMAHGVQALSIIEDNEF